MIPYLTVLRAGQAEQTIERSRFIGYSAPVKTISECEEFFNRIRREHRQASHNVPAYVIGGNFQSQWASDDGEPRGTAGAPIMQMLVREGISDTAIVVTRYYGGTRLGTGGLVRAYTGTAKLALEAAGLGRVSGKLLITIETDYAGFNRLKAVSGNNYIIESAVFTEIVTITIACGPETRDIVLTELGAVCRSFVYINEKTEEVIIPLEKDEAPG